MTASMYVSSWIVLSWWLIYVSQIDYLSFMAWTCIHSAWMHWLLAIFNAHDWTMEYVTTFSTEIFSLLNSIIYFHKA